MSEHEPVSQEPGTQGHPHISRDPSIEQVIREVMDKTGLPYAAARNEALGEWMLAHADEIPFNPVPVELPAIEPEP